MLPPSGFSPLKRDLRDKLPLRAGLAGGDWTTVPRALALGASASSLTLRLAEEDDGDDMRGRTSDALGAAGTWAVSVSSAAMTTRLERTLTNGAAVPRARSDTRS